MSEAGRAWQRFKRELDRSSRMHVEGVRTREDGTPGIVIHVGKEEHMAEQAQQLNFEGLPVQGNTFGLKKATSIPTDDPLSVGDVVEVHAKGTVVAIHHDPHKDIPGVMVRLHVIEVSDAALS